MKTKLLKKTGIGLLLYIFALFYLFAANFFVGYGFNFSFTTLFSWGLLAKVLVLVFAFPYLKFNSESLIKRGVFFGSLIWLINIPQLLGSLAKAWYSSNILQLFLAPNGLIYFIFFGVLAAFFYKTFLPSEFKVSMSKFSLNPVKTIGVLILVSLVYSSLVISSQYILLSSSGRIPNLSFSRYLGSLGWGAIINPLIFGAVLSLLYIGCISRLNFSGAKKWLLFTILTFLFTEPLIISASSAKLHQFWQTYSKNNALLLIGHLIGVAISGWVLHLLFDKKSTEIKPSN